MGPFPFREPLFGLAGPDMCCFSFVPEPLGSWAHGLAWEADCVFFFPLDKFLAAWFQLAVVPAVRSDAPPFPPAETNQGPAIPDQGVFCSASLR